MEREENEVETERDYEDGREEWEQDMDRIRKD